MRNREEIFDKLRYHEAVKYGQTLTGVTVEKVVGIDKLPHSIQPLIDQVIKISSVPTTRIAHSCSNTELSQWLTSLLLESNGTKFFFKPNEIFWKLWFVIVVEDFESFINNYISRSAVKDFYLVDISGTQLKALMDEEYTYDLFTVCR